MIMSSPGKVDPLAVLLGHSVKSSNMVGGLNVLSLSGPQMETKTRPSAAEQALKQLAMLKQSAAGGSPPSTASASRPLQAVDVNISKADRNKANRSCSVPPTTSPSKKVRSHSTKHIRGGVRPAAKANKLGSFLCHSTDVTIRGDRINVKVPHKLPKPQLRPSSSPYENLSAHLARHHLFDESLAVEKSSITPDYYLTQYLEMARLGRCSLYHQTRDFLNAHRDAIAAQVLPGQSLPTSVPLDVTDLVTAAQIPPTHLLAVHSDDAAATLFTVHGLVLALQCVSIPFLPASTDKHQPGGRIIKEMPVVSLRIPCLEQFETTLRWLYSNSSISLLQELLPLEEITAYLARRELSKSPSLPDASARAEASDFSLSPLDLVEAMATLSTRTFLERLQTIQAVWKNGVALGIVSWTFWTQLDHAWSLIIAAMIVSRRRGQIKVAAAAAKTANELTAQLQSTHIE